MNHQPILTPGHLLLREKAGLWSVQCRYFMQAGADPIEVEAVDRVRSLGPFWSIAEFKADMVGTSIEGCAMTGFDPIRNCFVATWVDSVTPYLYQFEGTYDEGSHTLTLQGLNPDPNTGEMREYRSRETFIGGDSRIFTLEIKREQSFFRVLEYHYKRTSTSP
ncbi:MAG: DUF1579 family protein [Acidobacteria bacterium]|nr:DUF1579 family protein [Acidobacteriota bacterium]